MERVSVTLLGSKQKRTKVHQKELFLVSRLSRASVVFRWAGSLSAMLFAAEQRVPPDGDATFLAAAPAACRGFVAVADSAGVVTCLAANARTVAHADASMKRDSVPTALAWHPSVPVLAIGWQDGWVFLFR
jgi:hypothetical protein